MYGEKNWWQEWAESRAFLPPEKLNHSGSESGVVVDPPSPTPASSIAAGGWKMKLDPMTRRLTVT
jgi:hypothetical protein